MKLQIKDAGAWRNLASFDRSVEVPVLRAASDLLRSLRQPKTEMRVIDGDKVEIYCAAPDYLWKYRI